MNRDFWVVLFTGSTWEEFLKAGGKTMGFRDTRWNYIRNIKPKDYLLCYLTGISRFIAYMEVQSEPYQDTTKIWDDDVYPARVDVKIITKLKPRVAVPVVSLRGKLSIFENLRTPSGWSVRFRASPQKWDSKDGEIVIQAIEDAKKNPVERPYSERLFQRGRLGPYSVTYRPYNR